MKIRALIVEDEAHSLRRLVRLLNPWNLEIEVVGQCTNGITAVEQIQTLKPDLLFLDIQLPGLNAFQILSRLEKQPFIIFTTAFATHALEAFKHNSVDYLLKPIEPEALERAMLKMLNRSTPKLPKIDRISRLLENLEQGYLTFIPCRVGERTLLVKVGEILYFQADSKYTMVKTNGKSYAITTPLVDLERQLDPKEFIRIHRGTLVNLAWIAEIRKSFEGKVKILMLDQPSSELSVSKAFAERLRDF